jgi:PKD repeat protein
VVEFTDTSTAPGITDLAWDFGDGAFGVGSNPTHTYAQWGSYNVKLTAQTGAGPFARTKTIEVGTPIKADYDRDGDLDQADFGVMQACLSGAGFPQTDPACQEARFDVDSDVDEADLQLFLNCMSGPGTPPTPQCH